MTKAMTLRAPDALHFQLKQLAHEKGQTLHGLILQILWEWVKHNPPAPEERGGGHE